ncbi:MAG: methionyl-tRNA formyltransferase [Lachnospiraceae bacterium]|nr:methionyl-tRNA formyltransferase [Lachnospiraceae bacterium]
MKIVFMGTPDFSVNTLEAILEAGHQVAAVVTQPDKTKGRGKILQATPVKEVAMAHGLTVYQPKKVREDGFLEKLKKIHPDVIVVVAFGQIIPGTILKLPKFGCINVHASLLPKYRGAAPIQWALINGEEVSGVTIMRMDAGVDTGDILSKEEILLEKDETSSSLFGKLREMGARQLVQTLERLEDGTVQPQKQPAESSTDYARMINKADGLINWRKDAKSIERLIRGMNPWPSAFTRMKGKNLKIWKADVLQQDSKLAPGTVVSAGKEGLSVQTGKGQLNILELQLEGKNRMDVDAFLRGCFQKTGAIFG